MKWYDQKLCCFLSFFQQMVRIEFNIQKTVFFSSSSFQNILKWISNTPTTFLQFLHKQWLTFLSKFLLITAITFLLSNKFDSKFIYETCFISYCYIIFHQVKAWDLNFLSIIINIIQTINWQFFTPLKLISFVFCMLVFDQVFRLIL